MPWPRKAWLAKGSNTRSLRPSRSRALDDTGLYRSDDVITADNGVRVLDVSRRVAFITPGADYITAASVSESKASLDTLFISSNLFGRGPRVRNQDVPDAVTGSDGELLEVEPPEGFEPPAC